MTKTNLTFNQIGQKIFVLIFLVIPSITTVFAQDTYVDTLSCSGGTPTFFVDLSSDTDSLWTSDLVARGGSCCTPSDNNCVQFELTLAAEAKGIIFDIPSGCGAVPGGALTYQIDCGPLTTMGEPVCLVGGATYVITFCKPGANTNCFSIQSFSDPILSADVNVVEGCSAELAVSGLETSSISWTSISPGAIGDYDGLLACTANCETTVFTSALGVALPTTIAYKVCGTKLGSCSGSTFCDTVYVITFPELDAQISPLTPSICFGDTAVDLTATGVGGVPPYSYLWSTGETTATINVNAGGTYFVEITDAEGCSAGRDTVEVIQYLTAITANAGSDVLACNAAGTEVSLNGVITGSTNAIWTGGAGTFLPNATTLNATYVPTSAELLAGSVTLTLATTGNGSCSEATDDVLLSFSSFSSTVDTTYTDVDCAGNATGSIDVEVTGGAMPVSYEWSTGATTEDLTGLIAGVYTLEITDNKGCVESIAVTIAEPAPLVLTIDKIDIPCFGHGNGELDVTVSGGKAPYSYLWNTGATTEDLVGLSAAAYSVVAFDANGCFVGTSIRINEPSLLEVGVVKSDITCAGSADGTIDLTPIGGTAPYTYLWNTGATTQGLTGLSAGTYSVIITDHNGCEVTASATITAPTPLSLSSLVSTPNCFGASDGVIDITATGGTLPYSFSWNTGATTEDITGLVAGTYELTVTDFNGCVATFTTDLIDPLELITSGTVTNVSCFALSDGAIDITPGGGTPPYTYNWDTGATTEDLTGLSAGTYQVTVTDSKGCEVVLTSVVNEPAALNVALVPTSISCNGVIDGEINTTVTGGTAPYSYLWNTGATTKDLAGLPTGTYTLVVTDHNGCELTVSETIVEPSLLAASALLTDPKCFEGADGEIDVTVVGGTAPYNFAWNTGETTEDLTGLVAGNYSISIVDSRGCTIAMSENLIDPPLLTGSFTTTDASCFNQNNGEIDLEISGGIAPYSYLWSTGDVTEDLVGILASDYNVVATDANGCEIDFSISVNQPTKINTTIIGIDETCAILNDGSADLEVTGGVASYSYAWDTGDTDEDIFGLDQGSYKVVVEDANGCTALDSVFINSPEDHDAGRDSSIAVCSGDGFINLNDLTTATIAGAWSELTASGAFNPVSGVLDLTGLAAGVYSFEYTIAVYTPCTNTTAEFSITVNPKPVLNFVASEVSGCGGLPVAFTSESDIDVVDCIWDFGDGNGSDVFGSVEHYYSSFGSFNVSLEATSTEGCVGSVTYNSLITVGEQPKADFSYAPSNPNLFDPEVIFENESENATFYEWDFGDGSAINTEINPNHYFPEIGNKRYEVTLKAINSDNTECYDEVTKYVLIEDVVLMYVPNAFTPDGGNSNNTFKPVVTSGVDVYNYHLTVFNRWGELVFESYDPQVGWNGTFGVSGDLVPDGVYVWKIDFRETMSDKVHNLFGNVSLLR